MRQTQAAIILGFGNHVSVVRYADERDMQSGEVLVTKEKCLAPLVFHDKPGKFLPKDSVTLHEFKHSDGNIYFIGLRPGADQNTNFEDVINFVKGDKLLPFRWL